MSRRKAALSKLGPHETVMTLSEVATYLRCHPSTVYKLLKAHALPAFRLGGDWRFLRSESGLRRGKRGHTWPGSAVAGIALSAGPKRQG
jgi:excisionase family DNA binding protein